MTRLTIKVENLSKEYVLGGEVSQQRTFREMLMGAVNEPINRLKRLQGSSKQQERFWALKDVNFSVNEGEVVGIIGANGAGKSTLLKVLSRITAPTKGQIQYRGKIASLLEVGTGFHPELSGRENIFINGAILGMTKSEITKRFDEIVEFAGVEKFLDTPVKRYSSGMYVRLAFAVAAHLDPDILIVDEVLAVGDISFQNKCINKMSDVSSKGKTVLFVSHNLRAVQKLCSRAVMLECGRIINDGTVKNVVGKYIEVSQNWELDNIDLSILKREKGLGEILYIKEVCLRDSVGRKTNNIGYGMPLIVDVHIESLKNIDSISIVFGINNIDEERILTLSSEDMDVRFEVLENDIMKIRMLVENLRLLPNKYSMSVAINSAELTYDLLKNICHFQVTEIVSDKSSVPIAKSGYVNVDSRWIEIESRKNKENH